MRRSMRIACAPGSRIEPGRVESGPDRRGGAVLRSPRPPPETGSATGFEIEPGSTEERQQKMTDRDRLTARAGAVSGIYQTIASVVIILGALGIIAGFVQSVANADGDWFVGIMAGILVGLVIAVYVVVAWAGVQMFALVAGYIHHRSKGDI